MPGAAERQDFLRVTKANRELLRLDGDRFRGLRDELARFEAKVSWFDVGARSFITDECYC